jgi:putative ABC transport system substrate-binding protein
MRRRDLITLLGGAAAAWPLAARAQQTAVPVIGFLNSASPGPYADRLRAFRQGLNETGYIEGRNITIEFRWADGHYDQLPAMAADLARRRPAVIVTNTPATLPAKAATTTIPIVFSTAVDPVAAGVVASLSRPSGNLTGVTSLNVEIGPKCVQLLHEMVPGTRVIALVVNPTNPNADPLSKDGQAAARALGLQLHVLHASAERDLDTVFENLAQLRAGGLVIGVDGFFINHLEQLADLALRHGVPAIYPTGDFAAAGGLMSYGGNISDSWRLVGNYTGRVLKGEKPADLPVQQSTKVELTINLKTAKALGITVPLPLLGRADEMIE